MRQQQEKHWIAPQWNNSCRAEVSSNPKCWPAQAQGDRVVEIEENTLLLPLRASGRAQLIRKSDQCRAIVSTLVVRCVIAATLGHSLGLVWVP